MDRSAKEKKTRKDFIEMLPLLKAQLSLIKEKEIKFFVEKYLKKHESLLQKKKNL